MSAKLLPEGTESNSTFRHYNTTFHAGSRICLGFVGATSGGVYQHLKLNLPDNGNVMVKFEYNGFTYSDINAHNSVTFYTYYDTNSPYQPSLVNWGEANAGIVNYYYSSDNKVVLVIQSSTQYTGGFLYAQTGRSHAYHSIAIVAHTSTNSTTGAY